MWLMRQCAHNNDGGLMSLNVVPVMVGGADKTLHTLVSGVT